MAMKTNKKRRKDWRYALAEAQMIRPDRFTDMMAAIAGGSQQACECCGLRGWMPDSEQHDVCAACRRAFGKLKKATPHPTRLGARSGQQAADGARQREPNVVWVDASYRDGVAGLAVCGALGEHTLKTDARSSTQAEVMALRWALDIAAESDVFGLTFRTDCQAAFNVLKQTPQRRYWTVEQVPRSQNRRADFLAGIARRTRDA